jgi:methylamine dehydrogenase accessory protein MauD
MMQTIWIVSMALQWLVIAALCVLVLSLVRQLGAMNLRLNGLRDREAEEGPALYTRIPPHELTLVDGTPRTFGGGLASRPSMVVFFSPSCGACADLPGAIAALVRDRTGDDFDVLAVISGDRASAAKFAAEKGLRGVLPVAAGDDFPEHVIPRHGVPFAIALNPDGVIAARGKPKNLAHLREMTHAARHMAELATTHAARDHEWGQSAPYWEARQN